MWSAIKGELFSFGGYCTREEFKLAFFGVQISGAAGVVFLFCFAMEATGDNARLALGLAGAAYMPLMVAGVATSCRRLHDIGVAGAPALLVAVAFHNNPIFGVVLWVIPGEIDSGRGALPPVGQPIGFVSPRRAAF
jgi:uncharacterized membrane protein YhaH (DUF805 family)